jgi:hypothetical protein
MTTPITRVTGVELPDPLAAPGVGRAVGCACVGGPAVGKRYVVGCLDDGASVGAMLGGCNVGYKVTTFGVSVVGPPVTGATVTGASDVGVTVDGASEVGVAARVVGAKVCGAGVIGAKEVGVVVTGATVAGESVLVMGHTPKQLGSVAFRVEFSSASKHWSVKVPPLHEYSCITPPVNPVGKHSLPPHCNQGRRGAVLDCKPFPSPHPSLPEVRERVLGRAHGGRRHYLLLPWMRTIARLGELVRVETAPTGVAVRVCACAWHGDEWKSVMSCSATTTKTGMGRVDRSGGGGGWSTVPICRRGGGNVLPLEGHAGVWPAITTGLDAFLFAGDVGVMELRQDMAWVRQTLRHSGTSHTERVHSHVGEGL